jgi:hypothetical protein
LLPERLRPTFGVRATLVAAAQGVGAGAGAARDVMVAASTPGEEVAGFSACSRISPRFWRLSFSSPSRSLLASVCFTAAR